MDQPKPDSASLSGCLVRLFWMALGNLILVFAAVSIYDRQKGFALSVADVVFIAAAVCLPIVRLVDIRCLHGTTADQQPATMAVWRRYTAIVLLASLAVWLAAHGLS